MTHGTDVYGTGSSWYDLHEQRQQRYSSADCAASSETASARARARARGARHAAGGTAWRAHAQAQTCPPRERARRVATTVCGKTALTTEATRYFDDDRAARLPATAATRSYRGHVAAAMPPYGGDVFHSHTLRYHARALLVCNPRCYA